MYLSLRCKGRNTSKCTCANNKIQNKTEQFARGMYDIRNLCTDLKALRITYMYNQ